MTKDKGIDEDDDDDDDEKKTLVTIRSLSPSFSSFIWISSIYFAAIYVRFFLAGFLLLPEGLQQLKALNLV